MLLKNEKHSTHKCRERVRALLQAMHEKQYDCMRQLSELLGKARDVWPQEELEAFCKEEKIKIVCRRTPDGRWAVAMDLRELDTRREAVNLPDVSQALFWSPNMQGSKS